MRLARASSRALASGAKVVGAPYRGGVQRADSGHLGVAGLRGPVTAQAPEHLLVPADLADAVDPHA